LTIGTTQEKKRVTPIPKGRRRRRRRGQLIQAFIPKDLFDTTFVEKTYNT
jgi:hypothetical protein